VGCEAPLAPAGFAAARIVADGGAVVLSAAEIEFRPSPAVLRAHGRFRFRVESLGFRP
jgi:hypothetical protein